MKKMCLLVIILLILPISYAANLKLEVYLDDFIYLGNTYTKLFKITNLDHITGQTDCINLTLGYNISNITGTAEITCLNSWKTAGTGEFTPTSTGTYTLCGWIINTTITACKNITVLNQGQEPPEQPSQQIPQQPLQQSQKAKSEIEILDIDNKAKFGKSIEVKLRIYRGDTRKYAVYAEIEDISKKTTMHFKNKFTNYTLTIPIQIKPNCNEKYPDGRYKVNVHGLGTSDSEKITVSGLTKSVCNTEKITIEKNITVKEQCPKCPEINNTSENKNIKCLYQSYKKPKIIYKSSSQKAADLVPKLIIAVLAIFTIILIWRR